MKSSDFINNRYQTWLDLEACVREFDRPGLHPGIESRLVSFMKLYRRTCADLSLAHSLFAGDQLVTELNCLVIRAMALIGAGRQNDWWRLRHFFQVRVPQLVISMYKPFIISCTIFFCATMAGYELTRLNPFAANAIVGDEYMYMTLENIQKGVPFAVYQSGYKYSMSSFIMANNIKVAFTAFAFGILYGVGTFMILLYNGLMLGSIAATFAQHGLLFDFTTTVLIHGTLELFAIMVAAAAGFRFGQSIFRPGMRTRVEAIYRFGNEAFMICAAMVPVFVIAGMLEGFVTPLELSPFERICIIFAGVLMLVLYLGVPTYRYLRTLRPAPETVMPSVKLAY